jgi:hypothetical protein
LAFSIFQNITSNLLLLSVLLFIILYIWCIQIFEKSIGYYTKAMALDTQMNLHKYDNYADKLVKRSESHVELGLLKVSGALSDAVKDIREADDFRRKILQAPSYKFTFVFVFVLLLCLYAEKFAQKMRGMCTLVAWWL